MQENLNSTIYFVFDIFPLLLLLVGCVVAYLFLSARFVYLIFQFAQISTDETKWKTAHCMRFENARQNMKYRMNDKENGGRECWKANGWTAEEKRNWIASDPINVYASQANLIIAFYFVCLFYLLRSVYVPTKLLLPPFFPLLFIVVDF